MREQILKAEIKKLRRALSGLIIWSGESPEGPAWATPEAKLRNRAMFEKSHDDANECFPEFYWGDVESLGDFLSVEVDK